MKPAILLAALFLLLPVSVFSQTQSKPAPPPTSGGTLRPKLADSPTGYIDNAIIGSQFRLRFDAGYGVDAPDRAEFFYSKCGCYRFLPPTNPNFDPNAPGPGGEDQIETNLSYQELRLDVEYELRPRISVFGELPFRAIQPTLNPRERGLADLRLGLKGGVIDRDDLALTGQLRLFIPTGNAREGLGTDHTSLEPSLVYFQKFSEGFTLAGELGVWFPLSGSAGIPTASNEKFSGNVFKYGFGGSYDFMDSSQTRVVPVVELVGWRVLGGFETLSTGPSEADGTNIVNLKIGARIDTGGPSSVYVGFGRALTESVWYQDIFRMEYRFVF